MGLSITLIYREHEDNPFVAREEVASNHTLRGQRDAPGSLST